MSPTVFPTDQVLNLKLSRSVSAVYKVVPEKKYMIVIDKTSDDSDILKIEGIAGLIWLALDGEKTISEIKNIVKKDCKCTLSDDEFDQEITEFINKMLSLKLVVA